MPPINPESALTTLTPTSIVENPDMIYEYITAELLDQDLPSKDILTDIFNKRQSQNQEKVIDVEVIEDKRKPNSKEIRKNKNLPNRFQLLFISLLAAGSLGAIADVDFNNAFPPTPVSNPELIQRSSEDGITPSMNRPDTDTKPYNN